MQSLRTANSARFQHVCLTLRRPSLPPSLSHAPSGDLWSGGHDAHDVVELYARGGGGGGHFKKAASLPPPAERTHRQTG